MRWYILPLQGPGELDLAPDAMYHEIKQNGKWKLA
jgi:hypothetical protein